MTPRPLTLFLFFPSSRRQYYYYYLTAEGIAYLREYLNLPADVVPQTHTKREARPARPAGFGGTCVLWCLSALLGLGGGPRSDRPLSLPVPSHPCVLAFHH